MKIFYFNHNEKKPMLPLRTVTVTFYELSFVLDGEITYYINNKKVTLSKGDILFIKPGELRRRAKIQNCEYVSYNYYVEPHEGCSWTEDERYCVLVKWDDFLEDVEHYIEQAFEKRSSPIVDKVRVNIKR